MTRRLLLTAAGLSACTTTIGAEGPLSSGPRAWLTVAIADSFADDPAIRYYRTPARAVRRLQWLIAMRRLDEGERLMGDIRGVQRAWPATTVLGLLILGCSSSSGSGSSGVMPHCAAGLAGACECKNTTFDLAKDESPVNDCRARRARGLQSTHQNDHGRRGRPNRRSDVAT